MGSLDLVSFEEGVLQRQARGPFECTKVFESLPEDCMALLQADQTPDAQVYAHHAKQTYLVLDECKQYVLRAVGHFDGVRVTLQTMTVELVLESWLAPQRGTTLPKKPQGQPQGSQLKKPLVKVKFPGVKGKGKGRAKARGREKGKGKARTQPGEQPPAKRVKLEGSPKPGARGKKRKQSGAGGKAARKGSKKARCEPGMESEQTESALDDEAASGGDVPSYDGDSMSDSASQSSSQSDSHSGASDSSEDPQVAWRLQRERERRALVNYDWPVPIPELRCAAGELFRLCSACAYLPGARCLACGGKGTIPTGFRLQQGERQPDIGPAQADSQTSISGPHTHRPHGT